MTQNTRNQQVAKLSIKYYIGQLFNRQPKGLHVNSTQMLVKISPLSFHTRVTCIETTSPLSDIAAAICLLSVQLCPHLNWPMFQLIDIRYVCLVHLLVNTPERIVTT